MFRGGGKSNRCLLYKDWEIAQVCEGYSVLMTRYQVHIDYQEAVSEGGMPNALSITGLSGTRICRNLTDQTTKSEYWRTIALGTPAEGQRGGYFRQAASIDSGGQTPSVVGDYLLTDIR